VNRKIAENILLLIALVLSLALIAYTIFHAITRGNWQRLEEEIVYTMYIALLFVIFIGMGLGCSEELWM